MSRVFFTDRDLGKRFPDILRAAGLTVECHADHFPHDCPDETWLAEIGRRGWVAVSHDGRIRYKPNELAAVVEHRVALLVVIGRAPYPQLAQAFAATHGRILAFLDRCEPPLIAKVYRPAASVAANDPDAPGSIALWYPDQRIRPKR